jgi:hypothetical protein
MTRGYKTGLIYGNSAKVTLLMGIRSRTNRSERPPGALCGV